MDMRRVVVACALCLFICCLVALFTEDVSAAVAPEPGAAARPSARDSQDMDARERRRAEQTAQRTDLKTSTGPTKLQKALGLGSIVVMIVVVKYL